MSYEISENIKGLIFDLDGTIVDNMPVHLECWIEAFAKHNAKFTEEFFYEQAGVSLIGVVNIYNERFNMSLDAQSIVDLKNKLYFEHVHDQKIIKPVFEIIEKYYNKLPMAIATGSSRPLAEKSIKVLQLEKYFEGIVTADDVEKPKPAPDCFLKAAQIINIDPQFCEVFEDGEAGLQAAKSAGMKATDIKEFLI